MNSRLFRKHLQGPACLLLLACAAAAQTAPRKPAAPARIGSAEAATAAYFNQVRGNPLLLHEFLWKMPKGGDLHNHLTGAAYAEHYIQLAVANNLCVDRHTDAVSTQNCANRTAQNQGDACAGQFVAAGCALRDPVLYRELIDAWSMRDFTPHPGDESGHDHFFDSFGKFGAAGAAIGDLLAEVVDRAAVQNEQYLELMLTPGIDAASVLGAQHGWTQRPDEADAAYFDRMRQELMGSGLPQVVASGREWLDRQEQRMRELMHCDAAAGVDPAQAGCGMTVRYIAQVLRGLPKEVVLAQMAASFELARQDPRVVSVNPVMPEDAYVPIHDYDLHMRMFAYFHKLYPEVKLAMHAGELAPGLVPPAGLRNHIRDAVEIAGAQRIGHGVDVMYEDRPFELLSEMARNGIAVEICLTSNDVILHVRGDRHPLPIYLKYGVPVAIATDDEGVSRSDMTREYQRAVESYGLDYVELKKIVRNSIEYSFLPPDEKSREKQKLEAAFAVFEREARAGARP